MYSDEDLTAYLDGELPEAKAREISAALTKDAVLATQLAALDVDKDRLRAAFAPVLSAAPAVVLPSKPRRFVGFAVAASIALAVGVVFLGNTLAKPTGWEVEVAHYQALYVAETLNGIEPDAARLALEITNANQLLGTSLTAEMLSGYEGMTLRRAQVLGFEGQTLIQIAYTMADGTPVAFCILKQQNSVDRNVQGRELVGLAAATWQNADHSFLTIGGDNQELMVDFANHLAAAL